ncbi:hypothetical protein [Sulfuriroseicoccus oceanibius]|uniref:Uncharacterized protein n=1 Tax=Sulfuriroseicoccus oceanibius TaxID=2707525 RepID=A0A6B3LBN2_9BACT|nr:hypothetical protein [Sulfuriroseicoccus oceanibius]QQL44583.1 hypothetical protein G3M56_011930 [Sulfuriroseicoccus oceanibius]
MGILSFFSSSKGQEKPHKQQPIAIVVDLKEHKIGSTLLGSSIAATDSFQTVGQGWEVGTKNGLLDYGLFEIGCFQGSYTRAGEPIEIGKDTTQNDILKMFGEPYWTDRSDGEVIMFYEYKAGTVELQFEFPDGKSLGIITLLKDGVLSEATQRKAYGVTKPWPPK